MNYLLHDTLIADSDAHEVKQVSLLTVTAWLHNLKIYSLIHIYYHDLTYIFIILVLLSTKNVVLLR